jgi:hypothetical protein
LCEAVKPSGHESPPCAVICWQLMNDQFVRDYPHSPNAELAAQFGVSLVTIQRWAMRCGLKKSAAYQSEKQRKNATGRIVSAESREKLRQKALGRAVAKETVEKILNTKRERGTFPRGEKHYKWKGGRPWRRFRDPDYIAWRNAVLDRDGYVCQDCRKQCKKHKRGLAAHRIKPYADFPDQRFDVANGLTLCRACHMGRHGRAFQPRPPIPCACGCGTLIASEDDYGRPRRFANHHHRRGSQMSEDTKRLMSDQRQGKSLTPEHRAKIGAGLRSSAKRIGRPPKDALSA